MSQNAIEIRDVSVDYMDFRALHNISWTIPAGKQVAILGPNGCGKSTLLRAITGYGHVTSGSVCVLGETLGQTEVHKLRRHMGIVDPSLARLLDRDVTSERLVATGFFGHLTTFFDRPSDQQVEQARKALADVGLSKHAKQHVTSLSSGQLSRVWLARALINDPRLLILDEPCSDLDLHARETLLATLDKLIRKRPELSVVMVTHHLEDLLPTVSDVLLLSSGKKIAQGRPTEILNSALLSEAFECPVAVQFQGNRWSWSVSTEAWKELLRDGG